MIPPPHVCPFPYRHCDVCPPPDPELQAAKARHVARAIDRVLRLAVQAKDGKR